MTAMATVAERNGIDCSPSRTLADPYILVSRQVTLAENRVVVFDVPGG
jgi:hypothetical protein